MSNKRRQRKTEQFEDVVHNKRGRKPGATQQKNISKLICKVMPRKERVEKLAELARGVTIQKVGKKGEIAVFTLPPDEKALRQLNEYDVGRPIDKTKVDITSDGKPVNVILIPPIIRPKKKEDGD